MAANPLSYLELEAFSRMEMIAIPPWEVGLLMRLDDAVLTVFAKKSAKPDDDKTEVEIKDRRGVRGLLSGIRDRMAARKG